MRSTSIFLAIFIALTLCLETSAILDSLQPVAKELDFVIEKARENIWSEMEKDEPIWNLPPWLGTFFLSEYYFELKAFNITGDFTYKSKFDVDFFKQKLLKEQEADGSWKQIVDLNQKEGSLDATIFNYWFLKDVGESIDSEHMKKAKKFILDHGGIENAQVMTKYKLATFGVYEWVLLPYVPLFIFKNGFPFYSWGYIKDYVAQWVYPHLTGLAYLRYHKTVFPVSRVCLQELRTSRSDHCEEYKNENPGLRAFKNLTVDSSVDNLVEEIIKLKGKRGAFGAYTVSTLLNLLSIKDYSLRYPENDYHSFYKTNLHESFDFIEQMYFNRRVPYEGTLDDGRYWDTILSVYGLLESGEKPEKVMPTIEYLVKNAVQPNGGIPYGLEFEYAPDIDDTAMLLMLYGKLQSAGVRPSDPSVKLSAEIGRTFGWLKSNQNSDGGFPAFDKNKNDNQFKIVQFIFKLTRIDKSAEIFDPSCPDIVGHMFEAIGDCSIIDEELVGKAVKYLYNTIDDGMWSARWGINYVYAVGSVIPGLARIGYSLNQEWVIRIIKRLIEVQQEDGGFGESAESYNEKRYVPGVTTASMTAWGLLALVEAAHLPIPNIENAIEKATKYLINNFKEYQNHFYDRSVIGTGHRGVLNLQYPVYAYSFPLVALSRVRKVINNQYNKGHKMDITETINKIAEIPMAKNSQNSNQREL